MRRFIPGLLAFSMMAGFSGPSYAAAEKFLLDKPHTQIIFSVNHLGFSQSYGKFLDYEGAIMLDTAEPAKSSVDVTIKTASVDMGDEKWDEHLKNADFFNVEKFPTMTFKSTKVDITGEKTANVTGDLTLLGVTKPVVLAVTHYNTGKHPMMGRIETGFSATATIKRSDFGMGYGLPAVGDEVKIIIEAEGYKEDKAAEGIENK